MYNLVFARCIADGVVTFITSTCYVFPAHAQRRMLSVQCFCYQETIDTQTLIYVCCFNEIIISGCYLFGERSIPCINVLPRGLGSLKLLYNTSDTQKKGRWCRIPFQLALLIYLTENTFSINAHLFTDLIKIK